MNYPGYTLVRREDCPEQHGVLTLSLIHICVSWLSAHRCGGLYRKSGPQLHLLRLLEGLRRP